MSGNGKIPGTAAPRVEEYLGRRVVLTCRSELSFCGTARSVHTIGSRSGVLVETDASSGFSIWCPLDFVKQVTVIPIPVEPSAEGDAKSTS